MDESKNQNTEPKVEKTELETLRAERDEYLNGWQRAKADFANAKKQHETALKEYRTMANEGLIEEILPVLQSFEMAFGNKEAWEKVDKNWRAGVEYIYTQLKTVVEQNGLEAVSPLGLIFDPMLHEAVRFEVIDDASKANTISAVIEKGYKLGGKLIKPAKVVVFEVKGE
jgi:molecular chaperone GrpE